MTKFSQMELIIFTVVPTKSAFSVIAELSGVTTVIGQLHVPSTIGMSGYVPQIQCCLHSHSYIVIIGDW